MHFATASRTRIWAGDGALYFDYIKYNIYHKLVKMLESSTPDGLAPLSATGILIFAIVVCGLFIVWAIFCLAMLFRVSQQGETAQKSQRVRELTRKMFLATFKIYQYDVIVCFVALLIFFLVIMGALNSFDSFYEPVAYLLGGLNSLLCGLGTLFVSRLATPRILGSARYSRYDSFYPAKIAANFQSFFYIGWTVLWMAVFMVIYQEENQQSNKDSQQIAKLSTSLICFAFGSITVSIGTRIIHSVYHKGAEMSVDTLYLFEDRLERNSKHPALIAKAVGEMLNNQLSTVLDTLSFLQVTIAYVTHAAATNVIGSDQEGEILFESSFHNIYLGVMAMIFGMIFIWLLTLALGIVLKPSSGDELRIFFNLQRYTVIFFLIGFSALVSYLCLPAQFEIKQLGEYVRHPYLAYLCILIGLITQFLITLSAELYITHPFFINTLSRACNTGSATSIIYGLSFGYFYNFIPTLMLAGVGFLANYWLGTFGVGLLALGFILIIPVYMNFHIVYSLLENASYIAYITNLDEGTITGLVDFNKTRIDFQPHINTLFYGLLSLLGYQQFLLFENYASMESQISINDPSIFLGILLGAMFPYLFSACLIRSINKSFLAIAFDIKSQIEQIPSMSQGGIDADFLRTNSLFGFQCMLSLKRFLLVLFYPFLVLGIGTGPKPVLGFLIGAVISGIQLGLSSGVSGCGWSTVKKEIAMGNLLDGQMNAIKGDSEWGKAAEAGNQVGQPLKDSINRGIHLITIYSGALCCILGPVFKRIHE